MTAKSPNHRTKSPASQLFLRALPPAALLLLLTACFPTPKAAGVFTDQSFSRMATKMARGRTPDLSLSAARQLSDSVLLLDTRTWAEYTVSHLPGAIWVGYADFTPQRMSTFPTDTTVVVYCSVGYRSERIGQQLQHLGFQHVYNLQGSLFAWANLGYPLVDRWGLPTDTIHGFNNRWARWLRPSEVVY